MVCFKNGCPHEHRHLDCGLVGDPEFLLNQSFIQRLVAVLHHPGNILGRVLLVGHNRKLKWAYHNKESLVAHIINMLGSCVGFRLHHGSCLSLSCDTLPHSCAMVTNILWGLWLEKGIFDPNPWTIPELYSYWIHLGFKGLISGLMGLEWLV